MDKNAIKKYAVWARRELITRVSQRAALFGVTREGYGETDPASVGDLVLSAAERGQRRALVAQLREKSYEQVMEEAAYTWFNRFIALRFMEVNGYLPTHVRVFSNEEGAFKPQILTEAINLELDGLDMYRVYALKTANRDEELYKYLLITQCNALSAVLPGMFQRIADYTELLFPENLLREGSVLEQMVSAIPEEDWTDQVQIIGWLYQYYNTEPKDKVFADLKKNIKISKEKIPAATQLFTPDWIVRYMVENSLGRLWVEGHPNEELKSTWRYYLEEAEQEPEVQVQLAEIRKGYAALNPTDLRVIDPCCGSGHILCYLFDVLMQIYESQGYSARDAVQNILLHNLWGLDIDERAAQLSYFTVMMKARQYDSRFFRRGVQPHVLSIAESNHVSQEAVAYFCKDDAILTMAMQTILNELHDAKEYGSILTCSVQDWDALYARFNEVYDDISMHRDDALDLLPLVQTAEALSQKYDVVVTNPPYMGNSGMSGKLSDYVKKNYPDSKSDLFAVFIERCGQMTKKDGYQAMITQHAWMFLSSFEKLRIKLQKVDTVNMAHLGARAFEEIGGEVVQTTTFVMRCSHIHGYAGTFCRLVVPTTQQSKENMFLAGESRYTAQQDNFSKIPGSPVAYWVSKAVFYVFENYKNIAFYGEAKAGMTTGDNNRFLRLWSEVCHPKIGYGMRTSEEARLSRKKWFPYNKGGGFRKWYGLNDYVVLWENDGYEIKNATEKGRKIASVRSERLYFKEAITWATLTTGMISCRHSECGHLFDDKGSSCFLPTKYHYYVLSLINSTVGNYLLSILNPTVSFQSGNIGALPMIVDGRIEAINSLALANIGACKADWDSFETSWDFKRHPLV